MSNGTVVLHVYEPGERADELIAAVATALGRTDPPEQRGDSVWFAVDDVERARELAQDALDEAGDDGRPIVGLRSTEEVPVRTLFSLGQGRPTAEQP